MVLFRIIGGWLLTVVTSGYLLSLFLAAVAINYWGDLWWPATILLFAPRWLLLAPAALLFPLAIATHRRILARVILATLAFGLFAIAHFEIPMTVFQPGVSAQPRFIVLTLNCDHGKVDAELLRELVTKCSPDVVHLQGGSSRISATVFDADWHIHRSSHLFIASRYPLVANETIDDPSFGEQNSSAMACTIRTPWSTICMLNVHFATPREGLESVLSQWWRGRTVLESNSRLRQQQATVVSERTVPAADPTIIAGDFNTPAESAILKRCLGDFTNAFSEAGWGIGNTHFTRRTGVRIDHVLVSKHWVCCRCVVMSCVGADHRPVLAELELVNP